MQVSLDGDAGTRRRGGRTRTDPEQGLDRVAAEVAGAGPLRLAGLMAVAPLDWEPARAFARLAAIAAALRADYPEATAISAGMSGDLEDAIALRRDTRPRRQRVTRKASLAAVA